MNCGAMLSMPLHGRSRYGDEPTVGERFLHSGWIEAGMLLILIGALVYIGMLNVWAREARKTSWVEPGTIYQDSRTGKIIRDDTERKLVPTNESEDKKYKTTICHVDDPSLIPEKGGGCPTYVEKHPESAPEPAHTVRAAAPRESVEVPIVIPIEISPEVRDQSRRVEKVSVVKTGMTRGQVRKIWGEPKKVDLFKTASGAKADRWYYGDPVLNLDLYSRYVEFDSSGIVVFVHDDYTRQIRLRPE